MKLHPLLVTVILLVSGCSTAKVDEILSIRVGALPLTVQIRNAKEHFASAPNRYFVELLVLEPEDRKDQVLHFVLDGVTHEWRSLTTAGSIWRLQCDEEAFRHERSMGFSFWQIRDLKPLSK